MKKETIAGIGITIGVILIGGGLLFAAKLESNNDDLDSKEQTQSLEPQSEYEKALNQEESTTNNNQISQDSEDEYAQEENTANNNQVSQDSKDEYVQEGNTTTNNQVSQDSEDEYEIEDSTNVEYQATGVYGGFLDSDYVEITENGTSIIYKITDEAREQLIARTKGETITFVYTNTHDVNIMQQLKQ